MSETTAVEEQPVTPESVPEEETAKARTVSLSTYEKERKTRRDLERRLALLEQQAEERRQAELTESERLKEQLSQAEARATEAERKAAVTDRSRWVVDAAVAAGFEKPGAAVKLVDDLAGLESVDDAVEAVKRIAAEYPGLLRDTRSPAPELTQVLKDGQRPEDRSEKDGKLLTRAELDALTAEKVNELDSAHPGLIERSYAALTP